MSKCACKITKVKKPGNCGPAKCESGCKDKYFLALKPNFLQTFFSKIKKKEKKKGKTRRRKAGNPLETKPKKHLTSTKLVKEQMHSNAKAGAKVKTLLNTTNKIEEIKQRKKENKNKGLIKRGIKQKEKKQREDYTGEKEREGHIIILYRKQKKKKRKKGEEEKKKKSSQETEAQNLQGRNWQEQSEQKKSNREKDSPEHAQLIRTMDIPLRRKGRSFKKNVQK